MIKRIALILMGTALISLSVGLGTAGAVNIFPGCNNSNASKSSVCKDVKTVNKSSSDPIVTIIKAVLEVISFIAGAMAVIFIIAAALRFITSGGGAEGVAKARGSLINVLIGVAILALSQSIIAFVLNHV